MKYDDPSRDRSQAVQTAGMMQGAQVPAPGEVTRTSKLPGGNAPAVQRQAAVPVTAARASSALASDLYTDMAHRGLTAMSEQAPVQMRGDFGPEPKAVHRAAAAGVSGAGGALPHADRIQVSFGPAHDISQVQANIGGAAAEASARIGAEAYATGDHLAFRSQPDLHTAAHEAAHVVQQRQGVHLAGGVGQAGDAYERRADAVADRVVRGASAEALLSGTGAGTAAAVQRRESPGAAEAADGAEVAAGGDAAAMPASELTTLLARVGDSPVALRSALVAEPALASRIPALVAEGAESARLSALMAQAFPARASEPAAAPGATTGATDADPVGKKTEYAPYEDPTSKKRVDHFAGAENDPFYGAEWDQSTGTWFEETSSWAVGSAKAAATSAKMTDGPSKSPIRIGHGDFSIEFGTVPTVLETREPLGSLEWGWSCKDEANAPIVLTGGQDADCKDTPSGDVDKAQDQLFAAKFEEILDGFAAGKSDLTSAHKDQLDTVVTKLKAKAALKVQLGGAADTAEADAADLSLARANAARSYLTSKGIDASRIEVQSYSASWARVKTTSGKDEPRNRRVQVWVR